MNKDKLIKQLRELSTRYWRLKMRATAGHEYELYNALEEAYDRCIEILIEEEEDDE